MVLAAMEIGADAEGGVVSSSVPHIQVTPLHFGTWLLVHVNPATVAAFAANKAFGVGFNS
jgi:hypothetical protein